MFSSHTRRPPTPHGPRAPARPAALPLLLPLALPLMLGACSGDAFRTLATDAGYGPKPVKAPDFVVQSRASAPQDYMPVGVDAPRRAVRAKNAEGQKSLEAELEGARGRNEALGRAAESAGRGVAKDVTKGVTKGVAPAGPAPAPQAE